MFIRFCCIGLVAAGVAFGQEREAIEKQQREVHDRLREAQERMEERQFELHQKFSAEQDARTAADMARLKSSFSFMAQQAGPAPRPAIAYAAQAERMSEESAYRRGLKAMEDRQYAQAAEYFAAAAQKKGDKTDGSLYWKAYSLSKLGKRDDALAAIEELRRAAPTSRWMNDAKVLEMQVRQSSGQPASPDGESDEDLKLLALTGIANNDPERAIPLVSKILDSAVSLKLKERALYVLAQTRSQQALPIVVKVAKGGGNPDLQRRAVEYLGVFGEVGPTLAEIYSQTSDIEIKRTVLYSYMRTKDKARLLAAVKGESNEELRREAIQALAGAEATDELWALYQESSGDTKAQVLRSIGSRAGAEKLLEIARTEKDPKLRAIAVSYLGRLKTPQSTEALLAFYANETDVTVKKGVLNGLFSQNNAKALVDLVRKESNMELKKAIVERLSQMRSKEASDYMVELLNK